MTDGGSGHQPSTRPAHWSSSSLPLGLCTVSAPTPEVGKEPPACPGRVPQSPPVPPTKTQLGVFTDSVTEAGTQTHHTAQQGLKVQAGLGSGERAFVCHPPSFSSHRPGGRWGGDNCSLSSTRLHGLPLPVLAVRLGSPAGNPSPAAQPTGARPGVLLPCLPAASPLALLYFSLGSLPIPINFCLWLSLYVSLSRRLTWKGRRRSSGPPLLFLR